jgi:hypothetical protein
MLSVRRDRLGWSFQPKTPIFISIVVVAIVLLAAVAAFLVNVYAHSGKEDRGTITFAVSLVGAGIAIYGLLKAADNIRQANAEKLNSSSLSFVQRWNSPTYWQVKAEWRKLNEELDLLSEKDRDALLAESIDRRIVAVEILNFYEEMATGINNGSLDGELLRGYWEPVIIKSFARFEYWIKQHRIRKDAPGYFDELEELVRRWKNTRA